MKKSKQKKVSTAKLFKLHKASALVGMLEQCNALKIEMDRTGRAHPYMAQMAQLHAQAKQVAAMTAKDFYEFINKKRGDKTWS